MGVIFYIMGKSSTGKDTLYKQILETPELGLQKIIPYTTRPMREGEKEGEDYYFVTEEELQKFERQGRLIEKRVYHTVHGDWTYATVDSGNIDLGRFHYLTVGTPESYLSMRDYYGCDNMLPIYIEVEDGQRLKRALEREMSQERPRYNEMCRRYLADAEDFNEEKLMLAGITEHFENKDLKDCYQKIRNRIETRIKEG